MSSMSWVSVYLNVTRQAFISAIPRFYQCFFVLDVLFTFGNLGSNLFPSLIIRGEIRCGHRPLPGFFGFGSLGIRLDFIGGVIVCRRCCRCNFVYGLINRAFLCSLLGLFRFCWFLGLFSSILALFSSSRSLCFNCKIFANNSSRKSPISLPSAALFA